MGAIISNIVIIHFTVLSNGNSSELKVAITRSEIAKPEAKGKRDILFDTTLASKLW